MNWLLIVLVINAALLLTLAIAWLAGELAVRRDRKEGR